MLFEAWVAALAFTLQLYFDFSGYSDMAIGLSRMFNVKMPLNFDSPYKAANIIDFWRRWHMTLSSFLRSYVYVPLGGNRKGSIRRYLNLLATMLLGGLWHGAGWHFVLWGGLHGMYLVLNHGWQTVVRLNDRARNRFTHAAGVLTTFIAVLIAWVPFRATSNQATMSLWHGMAGLNGISLPTTLAGGLAHYVGASVRLSGVDFGGAVNLLDALIWLPLGMFTVWFAPNTQQWLRGYSPAFNSVSAGGRLAWHPTRQNAILVGALLGLCLLLMNRGSEFLYFQF